MAFVTTVYIDHQIAFVARIYIYNTKAFVARTYVDDPVALVARTFIVHLMAFAVRRLCLYGDLICLFKQYEDVTEATLTVYYLPAIPR